MPRFFGSNRIFNITYPTQVDSFQEVSDGANPDHLILARYVNHAQDAVRALESHTQYTAQTPTLTGQLIYVQSAQVTLAADRNEPGLNLPVSLTVSSLIAAQYFENKPFDRKFGILVSAVGYAIVNGTRSYFAVRSGVNVRQELNNYSCTVNVVKGSRWRRGHVCEVNLTLVRP